MMKIKPPAMHTFLEKLINWTGYRGVPAALQNACAMRVAGIRNSSKATAETRG
jgi:hypothetical protein